ncbi:MAG TPA: succinate dehydrogenase, hydrophobic membrane anchor protein [Alphaproteobacteria bacterium]
MSQWSLQSDLKRVRGLGSAKAGVGHWWAQRVTALALIPLTLWFVASVIGLVGASHAAVVDWIASPIPAVLLVLLIAATFHHAQLGLQVVIEDYVHREGAKVALILFVKGAAIVLALAALFAVLRIYSWGG